MLIIEWKNEIDIQKLNFYVGIGACFTLGAW